MSGAATRSCNIPLWEATVRSGNWAREALLVSAGAGLGDCSRVEGRESELGGVGNRQNFGKSRFPLSSL